MRDQEPFPEQMDKQLTTGNSGEVSALRYPRARLIEANAATSPGPGLLAEGWQILNRYRLSVLLSGILGIAAAVAFTLPQAPIYQSRTSVQVQELNDNFLNMKSPYPTTALPDFSPEAYIETQIKILQSRSLLARVVARLRSQAPPSAKENIPATGWRAALQLPGKAGPTHAEAVAYAAGHVVVRALETSHLVEIFCDAPDPRVASDFANALVTEFIDRNLESRWQSSQHMGKWLTRQIEELKSNLEKSENALQDYARANGLMFTGEKTSVAEERLRDVQQELAKARAERMLRQSRYDQLTSAQSIDSLPEVIDDASVREYQTKLTELRRQLAELSYALTPTHYKVERMQSQIDAVQAALERTRSGIVNRVRNEYEASQRREKLLTADYDNQFQKVAGQSERSIGYNLLKREVDTNRLVYEAMLQKVKETSVTAAMRASNVSVVDPAEPAPAPYKPSLLQNSSLGLFAGLLCGVALAFARERLDRSIQTPGETASYLNLPELGAIPAASLDRAPVTPEGALISRGPESVQLITWQRRSSLFAESVRATLTSILFAFQSGHKPFVVVLTSSAPAEGKTTVLCNLGIAMAETRRRVLLIDADLRKPRLHDIFGIPNTRGLTDILGSEEPVTASRLEETTQKCDVSGVAILPSGSRSENISDLLYSVRLHELLRLARQTYDAVLIDTPPMAQMPDARVLARFADGVILIVRAGKTSRDTALLATSRFQEDGTPVVGTILNDWDPRTRSRYGYQGYYNSHYKYYSNGTNGTKG